VPDKWVPKPFEECSVYRFPGEMKRRQFYANAESLELFFGLGATCLRDVSAHGSAVNLILAECGRKIGGSDPAHIRI